MQFNKQSILLIPSNESENFEPKEGIHSAEKASCVVLHKLHNETASVAIETNKAKPFTAFSSFKKKDSNPEITGINIKSNEYI